MTHTPRTVAALLLLAAIVHPASADVDLVAIDVPQDKVWVGQKASFFVKLRGKGPFVGAASFSLPQIPRTVIVKIGNPVVSSEEIEDDTWFVQTHEFALFSQADGDLELPAFDVRFANRDGFTGPAEDHDEQTPATHFQIERPEGSSPSTYLVTTDSLTVEEEWDPQPGKARQGAVFHRTITQQADQITGMALAPPPETVPKGVRVHFDDPVITDNTERGDFTGTRTDRITYVLEQPGKVTLPAIQYVWWNPDREQYGSKTLPSATFEVAAVIAQEKPEPIGQRTYRWLVWTAVVLVLGGLCYWQWRRLVDFLAAVWNSINPPERRIAHRMLRACRAGDAAAAEAAWMEWELTRPREKPIPARLQRAATDLHWRLYGADPKSTWDGHEMAAALQQARSTSHLQPTSDDLPQLNPTG
ncbi:hypothetical protein [Aeoliella sp.]|uniref:BatD family protein n=1 Tax=Aeoliella sp. TaxID=2795800 RepID=UPI003CCC00E7